MFKTKVHFHKVFRVVKAREITAARVIQNAWKHRLERIQEFREYHAMNVIRRYGIAIFAAF
jgi:hypothetical protein